MIRTFTHEVSHFIEKHNPIEYNEFKKVIFALYSTSHTENPTVLYAFGGELAQAEHRAFNEFKEEYYNGTFTGAEALSSWFKTLRVRPGNNDYNRNTYGHPGKTGRNDVLDGRSSKRNPSNAFRSSIVNLTNRGRGLID